MDAHPQEELLSALLDDALPPAEKEVVTRHLARCHQCRQALAGLQAVRDSLRDLPQEPVPAGWREGLLARMAQEEDPAPAAGAGSPAQGTPWWSSRPGLLAGAAVVLLVLVVGGGLRLLAPVGTGTPAPDEVAPLAQPFMAMEGAESTAQQAPESDAAGDAARTTGDPDAPGETEDSGDAEVLMADRRPPSRRVLLSVLTIVLAALGATITLLLAVTRRHRAPPSTQPGPGRE